MNDSKCRAFTFTELLVVIVIIGVLTLLGLPRLLPLVTRAKSTEAKIQLKHLYELQKVHRLEYSEYAEELDDLDFEQAKLTTEGGEARYVLELSSSSKTAFVATATAIEDFDGDGEYNVWQIDQEGKLEEITPD